MVTETKDLEIRNSSPANNNHLT